MNYVECVSLLCLCVYVCSLCYWIPLKFGHFTVSVWKIYNRFHLDVIVYEYVRYHPRYLLFNFNIYAPYTFLIHTVEKYVQKLNMNINKAITEWKYSLSVDKYTWPKIVYVKHFCYEFICLLIANKWEIFSNLCYL